MLELENKVEETRRQGIQATKEVQQTARQVVLENRRLRELLRLAGFSDEDVDVWVGPGKCKGQGDGASCGRRGEIAQLARWVGESVARNMEMKREGMPLLDGGGNGEESGGGASRCAKGPAEEMQSSAEPLLAAAVPDATPVTQNLPSSDEESRLCRGQRQPPCKLLTRLAENASADITILPGPPSADEPPQPTSDAIECKQAYQMLMTYAVSEEKLDYVAKTLEGGCTANGKGGCAVKAKVILQALDDIVG